MMIMGVTDLLSLLAQVVVLEPCFPIYRKTFQKPTNHGLQFFPNYLHLQGRTCGAIKRLD